MPNAPRAASVLISSDMEGCATLVHWDEVRPGSAPEYVRARRILTDEVNAAAAGAFAAGANRVVVNDSHSTMRNIDLERADPRVEVISGHFKPHYMLQGIAQGFAAAYFIGYHGGIGSQDAVMGHTYSPHAIFECRLNGEVASELTLNAALAGHFAVPVVLVSGDATTVAESKRNLPWAQTVETKRSLSYYSADCASPQRVSEAVRAAAATALERIGEAKLFSASVPVRLEIDTLKTYHSDAIAWMPGFSRPGPRTVSFTGTDMLQAYRALMAAIYVATAA
ncbi:MAG: M55 family metallopeptidase [Candidatus Eremiobacter antarcticus]